MRRRADVHDWARYAADRQPSGACNVSQNTATLSGTVTTNGLQTNYGFEIGSEPGNYGQVGRLGSVGGALTEEVSVTLSELQPGTTYYYRMVATNADGTSYGEDETFTTPGYSNSIIQPATPQLLAIPAIAFPKEEKGSTGKPARKKHQRKKRHHKKVKKRKKA